MSLMLMRASMLPSSSAYKPTTGRRNTAASSFSNVVTPTSSRRAAADVTEGSTEQSALTAFNLSCSCNVPVRYSGVSSVSSVSSMLTGTNSSLIRCNTPLFCQSLVNRTLGVTLLVTLLLNRLLRKAVQRHGEFSSAACSTPIQLALSSAVSAAISNIERPVGTSISMLKRFFCFHKPLFSATSITPTTVPSAPDKLPPPETAKCMRLPSNSTCVGLHLSGKCSLLYFFERPPVFLSWGSTRSIHTRGRGVSPLDCALPNSSPHFTLWRPSESLHRGRRSSPSIALCRAGAGLAHPSTSPHPPDSPSATATQWVSSASLSKALVRRSTAVNFLWSRCAWHTALATARARQHRLVCFLMPSSVVYIVPTAFLLHTLTLLPPSAVIVFLTLSTSSMSHDRRYT